MWEMIEATSLHEERRFPGHQLEFREMWRERKEAITPDKSSSRSLEKSVEISAWSLRPPTPFTYEINI